MKHSHLNKLFCWHLEAEAVVGRAGKGGREEEEEEKERKKKKKRKVKENNMSVGDLASGAFRGSGGEVGLNIRRWEYRQRSAYYPRWRVWQSSPLRCPSFQRLTLCPESARQLRTHCLSSLDKLYLFCLGLHPYLFTLKSSVSEPQNQLGRTQVLTVQHPLSWSPSPGTWTPAIPTQLLLHLAEVSLMLHPCISPWTPTSQRMTCTPSTCPIRAGSNGIHWSNTIMKY